MSLDLSNVFWSVLTFAFTFAMTWGAQKSKQEQMIERTAAMEERIEAMHDRFVTLQQFNSTIDMLHQEQSEIRRDIKRILEILLHEPYNP